MRKAFFTALFSLALLSLAPMFVAADGTCPIPGTRPATAADAAVKNGTVTVGTCYNPNDVGVNQSAEQAKQDLQSFRCNAGVNTEQLDSKFSICADKFLKQLRSTDPSACINSAFRDPNQQAAACKSICGQLSCPGKCAAPGHSYHQKGLAVDMKSTVSNQILWAVAAQSGLVNPRGLNISDPRHIQSSGGTDCAGVAVPTGDTGDYYNDTNHFFPAPPSLPFSNNIRQALGMQQPPPLPPPPLPPPPAALPQPQMQPSIAAPIAASAPPVGTMNATPYPAGTCSPQTYCSQSDGNIYYRATTCVDQVYQRCTSGCSGVVCNASSTSLNSPLGSLLTATDNKNENSNTNGNGTSTFDLINFFANAPATVTSVGTATPIDINEEIQNGADASVLTPTSTIDGSVIQTPPQGSVQYGSGQQQTFTSGDLANSPAGYTFVQSTFAQQILAQMKATLLRMLPYVQPFGGAVQTQAVSE